LQRRFASGLLGPGSDPAKAKTSQNLSQFCTPAIRYRADEFRPFEQTLTLTYQKWRKLLFFSRSAYREP